jgi:hypothetical protein
VATQPASLSSSLALPSLCPTAYPSHSFQRQYSLVLSFSIIVIITIMKFISAALAVLPAVALATPTFGLPNPLSPIPGYPLGNPFCLSDQQAQFIVKQFHDILTNPNRQAAGQQAQSVIADGYVEESDSINFLAGYPVSTSLPAVLSAHHPILPRPSPTPAPLPPSVHRLTQRPFH